MVLDELNNLLSKYKVNRDFSMEIRKGYRHPLENDLNSFYDEKPNYRYGGSLAKCTANSNSCDIDLLCYFSPNYHKSLKEIYDDTYIALKNKNYFVKTKNSALCVTGNLNNGIWDTSVDIVPGKYTQNEDNKDVYLWCYKDNKKLKSNPEIQINKVKESNFKDLIRILKLYRDFNKFKFKSFYLELFVIDVVSKDFVDKDSLYDQLVKFCNHADNIGCVKVYDPANINNDLSKIHTDYEYEIIKTKIHKLKEALLTNDDETIINCILNKTYDLDNAYLKNAKKHSSELKISNLNVSYYKVFLKGYYESNNSMIEFNSQTILRKNYNLKFEILISNSIPVKSVGLIVSNAGYEAEKDNCLRGNIEDTKIEYKYNNKIYIRTETTSYFGNHVVQAVLTTVSGKKYYSDLLIVKIR